MVGAPLTLSRNVAGSAPSAMSPRMAFAFRRAVSTVQGEQVTDREPSRPTAHRVPRMNILSRRWQRTPNPATSASHDLPRLQGVHCSLRQALRRLAMVPLRPLATYPPQQPSGNHIARSNT